MIKLLKPKERSKHIRILLPEAKIDKKKMDDGEAFSYLLHTIRSKLGSIDKIDREKSFILWYN